jgi:hypothetical protein
MFSLLVVAQPPAAETEVHVDRAATQTGMWQGTNHVLLRARGLETCKAELYKRRV